MDYKPLQIEDMSLSDKDIIQDKDNSILNKSFFSTDFNFPNLVERKNFLQIKIESLEYHLPLKSKSIKKIFLLISNNDQGELEDNYLDYITCLIGGGDEIDKQQLITQNENQNIQNILEPAYYKLLSKTKIYYIDIPKLSFNKINKKITLRNNSLAKIASFLNMNIFDMSDFIEIFILSYQENESLGERFLLKAKLMGKLSHSLEDINKENEIFMGTKKFNVDGAEVEKCNKNKLHFMEFYFNNVWNAIEKENLNDENLSFSETPFAKEEENNLKNKNSNNNNNINYDLPNSNNINDSRNKIKNNSNNYNNNINKNGELKEENPCAENVCANICNIF